MVLPKIEIKPTYFEPFLFWSNLSDTPELMPILHHVLLGGIVYW